MSKYSNLELNADGLRNALAARIAEVERLRKALRAFAEADWYTTGHGKFEARLPGDAITAAKAALSQ